MSHNWTTITTLAYKELLRLGYISFPIDPRYASFDGLLILSYHRYSRLSGVPEASITCDGELEDAYVTRELRPGLRLILFNDNSWAPRKQHTLWHEIGHDRCGHTKHGPDEEIEAHYFAGQASIPNVLLREISLRGYDINKSMLMRYFKVSEESAEKN